MPHIKNALIRFRIIDRALRNKYNPYPSKAALREACEDALYGSVDGANICDSTIEKDMFAMKIEHDAPIKYSKNSVGIIIRILIFLSMTYRLPRTILKPFVLLPIR